MNYKWLSNDTKKINSNTKSINLLELKSPIKKNIITRRNEGLKKEEPLFIDNYVVIKKLGSGAFAEVYLAKHIDGGYLALKIEDSTKMMRVKDEYKIYRYLRSRGFTEGLPKIYDFIETSEYNIMGMQLLGLSLEDKFKSYDKVFQTRTVLKLAVNLLTLIEQLHDRGFIHRDIKPHNFMLSRDNSDQLYIVDFGLSRKYRSRTGEHINYRDNRSLIGTARYVSINMHNGIEPSRRDDLESIGYMLLYFLKGELPWQGLKKQKGVNSIKIIGDKKKSTSITELCDSTPPSFEKYLIYCRSLEFDEKPSYDKLREYFIKDSDELDIMMHYEWI
jgi:serine/threonine protein kinase